MANPDIYFAASPKEEIGQAISERVKGVRDARDNGSQNALYVAARSYFGFDFGSGSTLSVSPGGAGGNLKGLRINKARTVMQSLVGLVCGPPLTWRPQASNADAKARAAVVLATGLLEFHWKRGNLEKLWRDWVETAGVCAAGYVFQEWDETTGPELPDGDSVVRAGDVTHHLLRPWDVLLDESMGSADESQWVVVRVLKNKWDLQAMYPSDILGRETKAYISGTGSRPNDALGWSVSFRDRARTPTDHVPVFYFFHRPTPSLPGGRETVLVNGDCVLVDKPLSYPQGKGLSGIPVFRLAQSEMFDAVTGYSNWWDCLGVQDVIDGLETAITTNQLTLSVQSVAFETGTTVSPPEAVAGMQAFYYPRGGKPPEALQLTQTPGEVFNHRQELMKDQQDIVGLNDTAQGNPEAKLSGAAYALLASRAIERNAPFQKSATAALSQLGLGLIRLLEQRVSVERQVAIVGKTNQYLYQSRSYMGDDLKPVDAITVDIGNPVEQTAAGRFELAQLFVSNQWAKSPEELTQVLDTGRLEPLLQAERTERLLIAAENDMLREGKPPLVHDTQPHPLHAREHASVLNSSPDNQHDEQFVQVCNAHILEHYRGFYGIPNEVQLPDGDAQFFVRMRELLGQQPPSSVGIVPPQMPMPAPGAPTQGGAPPGGPEGAPLPPPSAGGMPPEAQLPQPAPNPMTGQPVTPPTPGAPP